MYNLKIYLDYIVEEVVVRLVAQTVPMLGSSGCCRSRQLFCREILDHIPVVPGSNKLAVELQMHNNYVKYSRRWIFMTQSHRSHPYFYSTQPTVARFSRYNAMSKRDTFLANSYCTVFHKSDKLARFGVSKYMQNLLLWQYIRLTASDWSKTLLF